MLSQLHIKNPRQFCNWVTSRDYGFRLDASLRASVGIVRRTPRLQLESIKFRERIKQTQSYPGKIFLTLWCPFWCPLSNPGSQASIQSRSDTRLIGDQRDTGTECRPSFPLDSFPLTLATCRWIVLGLSAGTPRRLTPGKFPTSRFPAQSSLHPAPCTHADQLRQPSRPKRQQGRPPPTFSFGNFSPCS